MSIMYPIQNACYICQKQGLLDKHHVWHGTANRRLSEQDGLYVWLCRDCHHKLHDKGKLDKWLMIQAEINWMMRYDMSEDDFIKRYGKSYI